MEEQDQVSIQVPLQTLDNWCQEWGRDPIRGPVADILSG